jgi:threonine dehydrogenase-like Zn-dependent dehydrogenase
LKGEISMTTGKLAALTGPYQFQIMEFPVPQAMEGSVVIKVEAASICGSDQHFVKGNYEKPNNLGHEFTGKIIDLGPHANEMIHSFGGELKVGDRIAVYPWITCNKCESCMTHGEGVCGVCDHGFIYGGPIGQGEGVLNYDPAQFPHFKGGFGEYVHIFPHTFVWKVPDSMPSRIATLLDPTAVAVRAIELAMTEAGVLQEGITTTTHALVVGAGPIGTITAMILRYMGVEQLVITDVVQKKLEMAKEISGADIVLNLQGMNSDERIQKVREMTGGGANVVFQCANHVSATIEGLQMARKLGTFIEVGLSMSMPGTKEVTVNLPKVLFERNVKITGLVANYPKTFDRAFRLLLKHDRLPFEKLITHVFHSLDDLLPTMKKMGDEDYLKGVLIYPA